MKNDVYIAIDSVSGIIFYDFVEIQWEIFFYRPVNADKPNFVSFLIFLGTAVSFTAKMSSFETVAKRESRPKTVNIQGYSELREPIRTRENCYPPIWWILKRLYVAYHVYELLSFWNCLTS